MAIRPGVLVLVLVWVSMPSCRGYSVITCPGTTGGDSCGCTQTDGVTCPEGYYCPYYSSEDIVRYNSTLKANGCEVVNGTIVKCPCTPGFLCPANTFTPVYCCRKYYCPTTTEMKECTKGHYCTEGSVAPIKCSLLADCPAKSGSQKAKGLIIVLVLTLAIIFVGFKASEALAQRRHVKQDAAVAEATRELETANAAAAQSIPTTEQPGDVEMSLMPAGHDQQGHEEFLIEFENLSLTLPSGTTVMQNVSGRFLPRRLCAVMGPSGAGKTTVINLVTGKVKKTNGTLKVNGTVLEGMVKYQKLIGFVPQEDIMIRELTVRDNISFSARYRLPKTLSAAEVDHKVNQTLALLGIGHVQHSIIGDEKERGISGGQRKRVNIGIELVAEPKVLFLDEPTSGLDSTTSTSLCKSLKAIAQQRNMTVASVIHQPSMNAFNEFDDLLLLGKGGRVVYMGPLKDAIGYFDSIGFPLPENTNPADYYLDVAQAAVPRVGDPDFKYFDLFGLWEEKLGKTTAEPVVETATVFRTTVQDPLRDWASLKTYVYQHGSDLYNFSVHWVDTFVDDTYKELTMCCKPDPVRATPGLLSMFHLCLTRAYKQVLRKFSQFIMELVLHLGCGLVISISAAKLYYVGPLPSPVCVVGAYSQRNACELPQVDSFTSTANFMSWGILVAACAASAGTFGNEQVNYFRESAAGLKTVPYFVAKWVGDIPKIFFSAFFFWLALSIQFQGTAKRGRMLLIVLSMYWFGWSLGYVISQCVNIKSAALTGVLVSMVYAVGFSGVNPSLKAVRSKPRAQQNIWRLSGPRWGIEAFYLSQIDYFKTVPSGPLEGEAYMNIYSGMHAKGYYVDHFHIDIQALFLLGFGYALFAMLLMKCCNKSKKK